MSGRSRLRWLNWPNVLWCGVYLAVTVVVLYPVLAAPVLADDLFNPFGQFDEAGGGPFAAIEFGWDGATNGASFRLLGNPFGALYNWSWLTAAGWFGISLSTYFAVTKLVTFIATAAAIAWTWSSVSELFARERVMFSHAMVWVSLMLFGTVQIHAGWSNDPVANYPLAGYLPTALGFLVIGVSARYAVTRRPRNAVFAAAAAVAAVTYYEINVGAVAGATLLLLAVVVVDLRRRVRDVGFIVGAAAIPLIPAALVVAGRFVTGDSAGTYAGTTVRIDGAAATFVRSVLTVVPGSAWRLSIDHLGGGLNIVFFVFGAVLLVLVAMRWWLATEATSPVGASPSPPGTEADVIVGDASGGTDDPGPSDDACAADETSGSDDAVRVESQSARRAFGVAFALAVATYACAAIAIQAITVKVQDEAPGVGYVYMWYAMASSAVALSLAVVARSIAGRRTTTATLLVLSVAVGFLFVQNTINWRLSEQLNQGFAANRQLLDTFDDDVPVEQRCAALVAWSELTWPGYYETGIADGINESFEYYFDESFCPIG